MSRLRSIGVLALLLLLAAAPLLAQSRPLTLDDLLALKQMGYSDEDVVKEIRRTQTKLALSPADQERLKKAGAGQAVLDALGTAPQQDAVGQAVALHQQGKPAREILAQIAAGGRVARPPAALLPAVRAGLPDLLLWALRGKPLRKEDLLRLAAQKPDAADALTLARFLGTDFALDAPTSLELARGGVPMEWIRALKDARLPGGQPGPEPGPAPGPGAGQDDLPNPYASARVGDESVEELEIKAQGQTQTKKVTTRIVALGGGKVTIRQTVEAPGESPQASDETLELKRTLKEQVVAGLERNGAVENVVWAFTPDRYTWQGAAVPTRKIVARFNWAFPVKDAKTAWTVTFQYAPETGLAYETAMTCERLELRYKLLSHRRGGAGPGPEPERRDPRPQPGGIWQEHKGATYSLPLPPDWVGVDTQFQGAPATVFLHKRLTTSPDEAAVRVVVMPFDKPDWEAKTSAELGQAFSQALVSEQVKATGQDQVTVGGAALPRFLLTGTDEARTTLWVLAPKQGRRGCVVLVAGAAARVETEREALARLLAGFKLAAGQ